ncbi:MAG: hypothetical protein NTX59_06580 [Elusimicrobia bacterium]|nr:hypothetical protein [Elusimicrobiota bacterium]
MKRIFFILAAISLSGCWFMNQPKAVVIATDNTRAQSLITALQAQNPELKASKVAVRLVKKNAPSEVLKILEWAAARGIKTIGIDGDTYEPGDPLVGPKLRALRADGVYVAGMEFAD